MNLVLGPDGATVTFPAHTRAGLMDEIEGPGGTWRLQAAVVEVETPHDLSWIASLVALPFAALIAFVLGQLRAIFRSLRDGSPFIIANARRLKRIGLGFLVFEALRVIVTITVVGPWLEQLSSNGRVIQVSNWPVLSNVFVGLVTLVLAEVFRRGTVMQDEQALTV